MGWEEALRYVRGVGWIGDAHFLMVRSGTHMQLVLTLMENGSEEGLEEQKDLRPEPSRLLVREDVKVELKKSRY